MKNTPLILSAIALVAVTVRGIITFTGRKASDNGAAGTEEGASATSKGDIVYFNLDLVINGYDRAHDLRPVVETKAQNISDEINRRGNKLQNDVNAFQEKINKGLITRSVAEVQGQKLEEQRNAFNEYANQKNQEMAEEQQVMMNNIGDAIKKFLDKYAADKGYAMILATQGDILPAPVAAGDSRLDITEDIIAGLNSEYVATKSKKSE